MIVERHRRDLVALVADKSMEATLRGLLRRPEALGTRASQRSGHRAHIGRKKVRRHVSGAESANAQGIARTEEMFLCFVDAGVARSEAAGVMRGLNDETLRAVVDPGWVTASGAFGPIHHRDVDKYPLDERIYELVCGAPERWPERLGFYGKWLFGDSPSGDMDPRSRSVSLYRTLRMNHHGWPFKWIPYARGGDPAMLKHAEAATRQMIDVYFCHYKIRCSKSEKKFWFFRPRPLPRPPPTPRGRGRRTTDEQSPVEGSLC